MAIRSDLNTSRSIDRAIADLIETKEQYDPNHPRAIRLAAMIEGLRSFRGQPADGGVAPGAR